MSEAPALDVVDVEKVYGDGTVALRGISLRIPPGCFFGLLGPNGSGKSTLIGMASGLVRAPRGRIFAFGHDVVADYHRARLDLGLAGQEIHLDRFLTAREVLTYHGRYFGMSKADARTRAGELLGVFDLAARGETKPNRLSGGMRRRLLIARALMHRPRLLILDEPTAGVDVALRMELWDYLRTVHRDSSVSWWPSSIAGRSPPWGPSRTWSPVVTGLIFLAIFGGALGDRLDRVEGVAYVRFILPGLLVLTVAGQAFANASTSLFQAKSEGYIEDVLTSPMRNWQLVGAYLSGGVVRAWLAALLLAVVALPFAGPVEDLGLTVAALVITGLIFATLGVVTGIWSETFDQHAFVANLLITPLALLGGVFYSADRLEAPWQALTRFDPIYYLVDATRGGWTGISDASIAVALGVAAAAAVALYAVAVTLVARGWRLKP